jgi:hypothetical protein
MMVRVPLAVLISGAALGGAPAADVAVAEVGAAAEPAADVGAAAVVVVAAEVAEEEGEAVDPDLLLQAARAAAPAAAPAPFNTLRRLRYEFTSMAEKPFEEIEGMAVADLTSRGRHPLGNSPSVPGTAGRVVLRVGAGRFRV